MKKNQIMNVSKFDALEIRCPKLGHQLQFSYCRAEHNNLPCSRSLVCWESRLPAEEFFRNTLTEKQWRNCFEDAPKPKVVSLLELIEKAKKTTSGDA